MAFIISWYLLYLAGYANFPFWFVKFPINYIFKILQKGNPFEEKFKLRIYTIGVSIWQNKSSSLGDTITIMEEWKASY